MLNQPLNHVLPPEPDWPPSLHIEFQKRESTSSPRRAAASLSSTGSSDSAQLLAKPRSQRSSSRSAAPRRSPQSSTVPSKTRADFSENAAENRIDA
jgi:hypothetical protein